MLPYPQEVSLVAYLMQAKKSGDWWCEKLGKVENGPKSSLPAVSEYFGYLNHLLNCLIFLWRVT